MHTFHQCSRGFDQPISFVTLQWPFSAQAGCAPASSRFELVYAIISYSVLTSYIACRISRYQNKLPIRIYVTFPPFFRFLLLHSIFIPAVPCEKKERKKKKKRRVDFFCLLLACRERSGNLAIRSLKGITSSSRKSSLLALI